MFMYNVVRYRRLPAATLAVVVALSLMWACPRPALAVRPTLYWGTTDGQVKLVQSRLRAWGYYRGPVDGVFGPETSEAVRLFQRRSGLSPDGIVGERTWAALGLGDGARRTGGAFKTRPKGRDGVEVGLLARLIFGEANTEPYVGQVAVGAVILNRVSHPRFPNSVSGVAYQAGAFESVSRGLIYRGPTASNVRAAWDALNGWDPTYGALYFWNPSKPVSPWIWSRQIITRIGRHVFAR